MLRQLQVRTTLTMNKATIVFVTLVINNAFLILLQEYISSSQNNKITTMNITDNSCTKDMVLIDQFKAVGKLLYQASQHVHASKPRMSIKLAITVFEAAMIKLGENYTISRQSFVSKNTCPEVYDRVFKFIDCKTNTSLQKIVTIILYQESYDFESIQTLFTSLDKIGNKIKVIVSFIFPKQVQKYFENRYSFVKFIPTKAVTKGQSLNTLLRYVDTEYALIGDNIQFFNADARLDRLVHEIESINVTVVGGAVRNNHDHWVLGCYQAEYMNYTLFFNRGYEESFHECVFCDFIVGPFLIKTNIAKQVSFDENLPTTGLFEDFFIRLKSLNYESVICSDVMFYVINKAITMDKHTQNWQHFADKYQLYRLVFSDGLDINFGCPENLICPKVKSFINSPCCSRALSTLIKDIMELCDEVDDIYCEIVDGTNLGAVKFGKPLPWELDGDIYFSDQNNSLEILQSKLEKNGYGMKSSITDCYSIYSKNWHVDFCRGLVTPIESLRKQGIKQTKVNFDGTWVSAPQNPGLAARNRYGYEIFRHVEHWMTLGYKHSGVPYHPGTFKSCPNPGEHNCLDIFNADGNIQFQKLFP